VPEANRDVYDRDVRELKRESRRTDDIRFTSGFWCLIVSNDPEKTFSEAANHIIYQANKYSEWLSAAGLPPLSPYLGDREQLEQSASQGRRPRYCDQHDSELQQQGTLPPGLPPRWAQTHLELFASMVIPAFS
jgi:hypothetical protein